MRMQKLPLRMIAHKSSFSPEGGVCAREQAMQNKKYVSAPVFLAAFVACCLEQTTAATGSCDKPYTLFFWMVFFYRRQTDVTISGQSAGSNTTYFPLNGRLPSYLLQTNAGHPVC